MDESTITTYMWSRRSKRTHNQFNLHVSSWLKAPKSLWENIPTSHLKSSNLSLMVANSILLDVRQDRFHTVLSPLLQVFLQQNPDLGYSTLIHRPTNPILENRYKYRSRWEMFCSSHRLFSHVESELPEPLNFSPWLHDNAECLFSCNNYLVVSTFHRRFQ